MYNPPGFAPTLKLTQRARATLSHSLPLIRLASFFVKIRFD
jgi:hypothetical protein